MRLSVPSMAFVNRELSMALTATTASCSSTSFRHMMRACARARRTRLSSSRTVVRAALRVSAARCLA